MNIQITPSKLRGTLSAISSKSDAHRTLIAAALSETPTEIKLNVFSKDMEATVGCICALGCKVEQNQQGNLIVLTITPAAKKKRTSPVILDCFESGSTARFLLPVAAVLCENAHLVGSGRLPERPFSPLTAVMRKQGSDISADFLPMTVKGTLSGGRFEIEGNISSQYITGLLFALPLLPEDSEIYLLSPLESVGYVDMTLSTLKTFGIAVQKSETGFSIKGGQSYVSPGNLTIEGDWSNSAFWICAGALSEQFALTGLNLASLQGDKEILSILTSFGAKIVTEPNKITVFPAPLHAVEIDAADIPDLVPALAVVASVTKGQTIIKNAGRLRIKESDRLMTICTVLTALGADIRETADGLIITGKERLDGGTADSFNDHRIAMALTIASCVCTNDVTITGAEAVEKSYPNFYNDFQSIGGIFRVL